MAKTNRLMDATEAERWVSRASNLTMLLGLVIGLVLGGRCGYMIGAHKSETEARGTP